MSRYIDADDVANAIYHHFPSIRTMADARGIIEEAPSIDIEPKHGEWIRTGRTNIYGGIEVQCSNCGDRVMVQNLEDEWYCRHCGADMGMKGADDEASD